MKHRALSIVIFCVTLTLSSCNLLPSSMSTPTSVPISKLSPMDCDELKLTPEQCMNAGVQQYSVSTEILYDKDGKTCGPYGPTAIVSIGFLSQDGFQFSIDGSAIREFSQKQDNLFENAMIQPDGKFEWKHTIIFKEAGFTRESDSYTTKDNLHLCKYFLDLVILRP
jgi:hypothetical protein